MDHCNVKLVRTSAKLRSQLCSVEVPSSGNLFLLLESVGQGRAVLLEILEMKRSSDLAGSWRSTCERSSLLSLLFYRSSRRAAEEQENEDDGCDRNGDGTERKDVHREARD